MTEPVRDHAVTTLARLEDEIHSVLYMVRDQWPEDLEPFARRLSLSAREYAAALVEEHARGPYRNRAERHAARREAAS